MSSIVQSQNRDRETATSSQASTVNKNMSSSVTEHLKPHQWVPGQSGNPSGKLTKLAQMNATLHELDFDPIREAVARFRDPRTPNASRDFCLGLIIDRCLPKLKSVEIKGGSDALSQVLINIVSGTQPATLEQSTQPMIESEPASEQSD